MKTHANNNEKSSRWNTTVNALLLGALLGFVVPEFYNLHKNAHISYKPGARVEWLQPAALDPTLSMPITNDSWGFDFVSIESLLWKSKTSESGELLINSDTLRLLEQTAKLLPETFTPKESKRLSTLIEKSMPNKLGRQLDGLFMQYQLYQQDYQASLNEISEAEGDNLLALLKTNEFQLRPRQERYFGTRVTANLFREKNVTNSYLNQRRIIILTKGLTKAQTKERLDSLKEAYKVSLRLITGE